MTVNNEFRIDFIGIGTGKSGTTWLAEMLRLHPGIYYPSKRKEINFFNALLPQDYKTSNPEYLKSKEWYHGFFEDRKNGQLCGEITPSYLSMPNAAKDIFEYNPHVKLFALLRNPAERCFSEYLFSLQNGVCPYRSFEEAIDKNPVKYLETSLYFEKLQPFLKLFPKENVGIFFFDDMKNDAKKFLSSVYHFIGVKDFFPGDAVTPVNVGMQAKNQKLNNFIGKTKMFIHSNKLSFLVPVMEKTGLMRAVKKVKEKNLEQRTAKQIISVETRKKLNEYFNTDIENLQQLTGRNLEKWYN